MGMRYRSHSLHKASFIRQNSSFAEAAIGLKGVFKLAYLIDVGQEVGLFNFQFIDEVNQSGTAAGMNVELEVFHQRSMIGFYLMDQDLQVVSDKAYVVVFIAFIRTC